MSITIPNDARGPILDLTLPPSEDAVDIVLRNVTTGKTLMINLPEEWDGDDLTLDFYRRTIVDQEGNDRSALLSATDNELWTPEPLIADVANDVRIAARTNTVGAPNTTWLLVASGEVNQVAVDASYVYWTELSKKRIGRAKIDGSEPSSTWLSGLTYEPRKLVVNGSHIFWTAQSNTSIARAKIDGSEPNESFITAPTGIGGVAIDDGYVYWIDGSAKTIGRANLDGSSPNNSFITFTAQSWDLAVDDSYIYIAQNLNNRIARAKIDGSNLEENWLSLSAAPLDAIVDAFSVYWVLSKPAIGRANIDGSGVEEGWLSGITPASSSLARGGAYIYWRQTGGYIGRALVASAYGATAALRWEKGYY